MITHDKALTPLKEIAEKLTRKQWLELTEKIETIRAYITQQEKKDKLLELYREHHNLVPFKTGLGDKSKRVCDISIEIKELEKELEEMK